MKTRMVSRVKETLSVVTRDSLMGEAKCRLMEELKRAEQDSFVQ